MKMVYWLVSHIVAEFTDTFWGRLHYNPVPADTAAGALKQKIWKYTSNIVMTNLRI